MQMLGQKWHSAMGIIELIATIFIEQTFIVQITNPLSCRPATPLTPTSTSRYSICPISTAP
jgi:hypothetical protein